MSKRQFLIILGVWVMVFLFLHFPSTWDKVFALVTGLLIIVVAFKFKPTIKKIPSGQVPYVEYKNSTQTPITPLEPAMPNTITNTDSLLAP